MVPHLNRIIYTRGRSSNRSAEAEAEVVDGADPEIAMIEPDTDLILGEEEDGGSAELGDDGVALTIGVVGEKADVVFAPVEESGKEALDTVLRTADPRAVELTPATAEKPAPTVIPGDGAFSVFDQLEECVQLDAVPSPAEQLVLPAKRSLSSILGNKQLIFPPTKRIEAGRKEAVGAPLSLSKSSMHKPASDMSVRGKGGLSLSSGSRDGKDVMAKVKSMFSDSRSTSLSKPQKLLSSAAKGSKASAVSVKDESAKENTMASKLKTTSITSFFSAK